LHANIKDFLDMTTTCSISLLVLHNKYMHTYVCVYGCTAFSENITHIYPS